MVDTASTSTTSNSNQENAPAHNTDWPESLDFSIQLRCAIALGWAMTELLGRCVVFKRELIERIQKNDPLLIPKFGEHTVILSPIRDRRERARAVMGRILFLASVLGISDCKIDRPCKVGSSDHELLNSLKYTEALDQKVGELCNDGQKTAEEIEDLCAKINWLLYYWTETVQVELQKLPPEVYNGYTVGRGFSTIRWYIGIGAGGDNVYQTGEFVSKNQDKINTAISTTEKNALNLFWQHSQQGAINAKTFVSPLSNPADVDDGD